MPFVFAPPQQPVVPILDERYTFFPIHRVYGVAKNYAEPGTQVKDVPFFFMKPADTVAPVAEGECLTVPMPSHTNDLKHEIELVAALGKGGRNMTLEEAAEAVWGWCVGIDFTLGDQKMPSGANDITRAKSFERAAPVGYIRPAYRCYLLLSEEHPDHRKLYEYIREGWAEYIPYLGKNEYPAWFGDSFREYAFKTFVPETDFRVSSLFIKEGVLKGQQVKASFSFSLKGIVNRGSFVYFERLPVGFHPVLMQYELADFAFTDWTLQAATQMVNLYQLEEEGKIVQLFRI